ncbi:MAG: outer membrane protein assembly factor BamA [Hyphomicrobiales bacterium]|nr:outer membrane protein assembly factor BamA [Hyphomicrobiales bacterium]
MSRLLKACLLMAGLCLAMGLGLVPGRPAVAQSSGEVTSIVIEGAQRIEPSTIQSYLVIKVGDRYSASLVDQSLKRLFATGLFADVRFRHEGGQLTVTVLENPVINRIAFEGNRRVEDDTLRAEVTLRPRIIYTRTKVQADVQRILTVYRRSGRFAATVEPKVIQLPQNRIDLVFEINEGELTAVRDVRFVGNRHFSDFRLREVVRTKETRWYRFLTSDDSYDPDRLTLDRELLRRFYLNEGFADFRVLSSVAELTPDRSGFFITFSVDEGARYEFGEIKVETRIRGLQPEDIQDVLTVEQGDWYEADEVDRTIDKLTDRVGNMGFAFVDIRPRVNRDAEARKIAITFEVNEGPRVFVERIDINGNVRTVDDVIRREFRLVEGDAFNAAKLRRSKQRLHNLDFFSKVEVERVPGSSPDKTVIKVDVEEKSTGSLSVGAGYSTTNGAVADFGIQESNLLGRGYNLRLKLLLAQRQSQIDLGFTNPWFLDREIAAGFDVFHVVSDRQDESSYDDTTSGFALRAAYPVYDHLVQGWKYTLRRTEVENVASSASTYVKSQEGVSVLSQVTHTLTYDRRNSRLLPSEGYVVRMTNDVAGLGGTSHFMRNKVDGAYYYQIYDQWVVSVSGSTGYIFGLGEDVELIHRFFIGGDDLRGFATAGVGPRDTRTQDALGGEWMYAGALELKFPLGLPSEIGINGRVFTDIGSTGQLAAAGPTVADTGSLRASAGFGLSWISPFGPIGVDFGFPILKENFDIEETIRINFGTRF